MWEIRGSRGVVGRGWIGLFGVFGRLRCIWLRLGIVTAVVVIGVLRGPWVGLVPGQLVFTIARVGVYRRDISKVGMFLPTSAIL